MYNKPKEASTLYSLEWVKLKILTIPSVDEDVELKLSHIALQSIKVCNTLGNSLLIP